jgi:hypothetical protein
MQIINGIRRYGGPDGYAEDPRLCVEEIRSYESNWPSFHQCSRRRGHGPDGLYCRQHTPEVKAARATAQKVRDERAAVAWEIDFARRAVANIAVKAYRQQASFDDLEREVVKLQTLLDRQKELGT